MRATIGSQTRLVVVGGGTAGWLSAMILQAEAKRRNLPIEITLVESCKIPTIGVGKGTTSIFGGVLQSLGIDEGEFVSRTDATIKYGIRHKDWRRLAHTYDGPIDDVYALADRVSHAGAWIDTFCVAAGRSVTEPHLFQALMKHAKAPAVIQNGRSIRLSQYHHAYHFDQAKVGAFLREKSQGIAHIDAMVDHVHKNAENGDIISFVLDNGQTLEADFFFDCTGFNRRLIAQQVDDFRDFINLHYVSERNDSQFWRDASNDLIQKETRAKVEHWQTNMPNGSDFMNNLDGLPHVEELLHYPVLDGLGLLNRDVAKSAMSRDPKFRAFARETVDHLSKQAKDLALRAVSHRAWLTSLK